MMRLLGTAWCLLQILALLTGQQLRGSTKTGTGDVADKVASAGRKHGTHSKPKLHYLSSLAHIDNKYGVDLPAFAFDYSELFAGAMIERSTYSQELYLVMFLVGHKAAFTDFPFHAISTDEEVMHPWSKAIGKWEATARAGAKTGSSSTHQHLHAPSSGLSCVIRNNDGPNSPVYQSPASWVHVQNEKDPTSMSNSFAILRCRMRSSGAAINAVAAAHSNTTYRRDKEVFVDIMRAHQTKRGAGHRHNISSEAATASTLLSILASKGSSVRAGKRLLTSSTTSTTATTGTSMNTNATSMVAADSRGTVLTSFSIPWSSRTVGYTMTLHQNASALDLWAKATTSSGTAATAASGGVTSGDTAITTTTAASTTTSISTSGLAPHYPYTPATHSTLLCVPSVRPLHPQRAVVALPMLLEFLEHHLQLGFTHIALGMTLDWRSSYMTKHLHVLRPYIQRGQISMHSTTLPGFDDVPGFAGIQLNDAYAEQFFLNKCLYMAKGLYRYVAVLRPEEFLLPGPGISQGGTISEGTDTEGINRREESFLSKLLGRFKLAASSSGMLSGEGNSTIGGGGSGRGGSGSRGRASSTVAGTHCYFALNAKDTTASTTSTTATVATTTTSTGTSKSQSQMGVVAGDLDVFGIEDPVTAFGGWGSGESTWSRDYFASSAPRRLHAGVTHGLRLFPTDRVVRLDVSPTGRVSGHCRHSGAAGAGSRTSASASLSSGGGGVKKESSGPVRRLQAGRAHRGVPVGSGAGINLPFTAKLTLPDSNVAALFVYRGEFAAKLFALNDTTNAAADATLLKQYLAARAEANTYVSANLKIRGLGTIAEVKAQVKQAAQLHKDQRRAAAAVGGEHAPLHDDLAHHVPRTAKSVGSMGAGGSGGSGGSSGGSGGSAGAGAVQQLPGRGDVKAPFWQLCNTDHLRDVIRRVFHSI